MGRPGCCYDPGPVCLGLHGCLNSYFHGCMCICAIGFSMQFYILFAEFGSCVYPAHELLTFLDEFALGQNKSFHFDMMSGSSPTRSVSHTGAG